MSGIQLRVAVPLEKRKTERAILKWSPWQKNSEKNQHPIFLNYFQDPCLIFCKHNLCFTCLRNLKSGNQDILSPLVSVLTSWIQKIQPNTVLGKLVDEIKVMISACAEIPRKYDSISRL